MKSREGLACLHWSEFFPSNMLKKLKWWEMQTVCQVKWMFAFMGFLDWFWGFPCGSAGQESTCSSGDLGLIPGLGRSSGEGKGYPLQYSGLENSMDSIVHGVTKSRTQLSDFHFLKRILFINGFSLFIWLLRKLNRLFYVASQSFSINTPKEWLFSILHTYLNHLGDLKMWGFWVPGPEILNK